MYGGFASLHPGVCFYYYTNLFLVSMLFLHPLYLVTALIVVVCLNVFHDKARMLKKSLPFYLVTGMAVFLINPLFSHRGEKTLFYLFDQAVTAESVMYGLVMMLSLLTITIAFLSYNHVMTADKFLYLFSSFSPKVALLTVMAVRFVPLLKRRLEQLALIQRTRGINVHTGSIAKRAKNGMHLLHILLSWSLEEGLETADSVKARGYGTGERTSYVRYPMGTADWTALICMIIGEAGALAGLASGHGKLMFYPALESPVFSSNEWIAYMFFCFFLCIPLVMEGREALRWHFLK